MTSGGSRSARSCPVFGAAVASDGLRDHSPHLHSRHPGLSMCLTSCARPASARRLPRLRRYKMGDGYAAFWRHAHKSEPIVVYSVILGVLGACPALPPFSPPPPGPASGDHGQQALAAECPGHRKSSVCGRMEREVSCCAQGWSRPRAGLEHTQTAGTAWTGTHWPQHYYY